MNSASQPRPEEPAWVRLVRARVEGLRYGSVQIVVHEAKVVQIECTERLRPDPAGPGAGGSEAGGSAGGATGGRAGAPVR